VRVLADTSVWVRHFRGQTGVLGDLLRSAIVVMHPWVRLEVALGTPPRRRETLALMANLETLPLATAHELEQFIERRALHDRGIGLVDTALLASVLLKPGTCLWTYDASLNEASAALGCDWSAADEPGR
jgi:predicted nucleic acid-binding protein